MKRILLVLFVLLTMPSLGSAQDDWLRPALRSSCEVWDNCRYQRLKAYRERQTEARQAAWRRQRERESVVADWERCIESGRRHCGPRPYVSGRSEWASGNGPQCIGRILTAKGGAANTETGALNQAKRAIRSMVRADHGEVYQDLAFAKQLTYRCWRASTNESVLGSAAERVGSAFNFDTYQKRCQLWLNPCMPPRVPLKIENDND